MDVTEEEPEEEEKKRWRSIPEKDNHSKTYAWLKTPQTSGSLTPASATSSLSRHLGRKEANRWRSLT